MKLKLHEIDGPDYLHSSIKEKSLKILKYFHWELCHGGIHTNGRVQRRMSYCYLSPSWCALCKKDLETQRHLFIHCPFAHNFWSRINEADRSPITEVYVHKKVGGQGTRKE